jgi:hypothetical protein
MNPGSSHPEETKCYKKIPTKLLDTIVATAPDKTQYKIMDFMQENSLEYACVLNLSDVCNQKSSELKQPNTERH